MVTGQPRENFTPKLDQKTERLDAMQEGKADRTELQGGMQLNQILKNPNLSAGVQNTVTTILKIMEQFKGALEVIGEQIATQLGSGNIEVALKFMGNDSLFGKFLKELVGNEKALAKAFLLEMDKLQPPKKFNGSQAEMLQLGKTLREGRERVSKDQAGKQQIEVSATDYIRSLVTNLPSTGDTVSVRNIVDASKVVLDKQLASQAPNNANAPVQTASAAPTAAPAATPAPTPAPAPAATTPVVEAKKPDEKEKRTA